MHVLKRTIKLDFGHLPKDPNMCESFLKINNVRSCLVSIHKTTVSSTVRENKIILLMEDNIIVCNKLQRVSQRTPRRAKAIIYLFIFCFFYNNGMK